MGDCQVLCSAEYRARCRRYGARYDSSTPAAATNRAIGIKSGWYGGIVPGSVSAAPGSVLSTSVIHRGPYPDIEIPDLTKSRLSVSGLVMGARGLPASAFPAFASRLVSVAPLYFARRHSATALRIAGTHGAVVTFASSRLSCSAATVVFLAGTAGDGHGDGLGGVVPEDVDDLHGY